MIILIPMHTYLLRFKKPNIHLLILIFKYQYPGFTNLNVAIFRILKVKYLILLGCKSTKQKP